MNAIMEQLRTETWPQHQDAERQELEKQLIAGTIPREMFVEYLAQRHAIHRALETALDGLRAGEPRLRELLVDQRRHEARIAADLDFFGKSANAITPLPATARFVDIINQHAAKNPISLLGAFYVTEGSTNGASFIARVIRKSFNLPDGKGTAYLDPYGAGVRSMWGSFKQVMDSIDFTTDERAAIIALAQQTFTSIMEIDREIAGATR